ncbi:crotonase/enoyl-CoA hydratase family protein [Methylobacterium isbiliense]|uniref:Methylthioacryloyl-CoA hydratase n=1 Tax=Methylobacterium isbiliense TaxID=315478 RepID=A0ABQ4SLE2_9HYPH|nr:crotonase/enoyl-CoA hydratase family protein [Methylobacterium isbiliense]MDN3626571.1 crotonase/enoyl-CoA hydratase family protein [Methylobacterium isbiliense]GJE03972.1 Methylthioacryloyl-CoA hydratase [Methylobacterium isbiliense]
MAQELSALGTDAVRVARREAVAVVRLSRPAKRNALDDGMILALERIARNLPDDVRALVLAAEGEHFCAGLDLAELTQRDAPAGMLHSRMWHRAFHEIEFGRVPVVAALKGAVIGGGLELALAAHLRVAETSAFYALPEGQRGIFVGGGASVRLPRLIGVSRMRDMMLTGRVHDAESGERLGISHYVVPPGEGLERAVALAARAAENAPLTNYALIHALPRIAEADPATGYLAEALMTAVAQSDAEAKRRLADFLEGRAKKVRE